MTASLRIQSSKADSNTWESFTRSGLKLESVHQESPRSDIFRKRAAKPLLNQRQCQNHLTWAVEKSNWNLAFNLEIHYEFVSGSSDFIATLSHNCEFISCNSDFLTSNCEFISEL